MRFTDRTDAGARLAAELKKMSLPDAVVLCIPRGGVVVGDVVAEELKAPLDLVVPRKIGDPRNPEMAVGAVAQDGSTYLNEKLVSLLGVDKKELDRLIESEVREIDRRMTSYRGSADYPDFKNNSLILVDDGAATGYTMLAAARFARNTLQPARLVIAVPVAPPETLELFGEEADEIVCLHAPENFYAVGQFYLDFSQTGDREVLSILARHKSKNGRGV
ncbi:MAG: phosphoribosyltransferase [Peptococcaceae bacterium]|nr:phosphoribosyltransferase [Peptococcaceae bacterium]